MVDVAPSPRKARWPAAGRILLIVGVGPLISTLLVLVLTFVLSPTSGLDSLLAPETRFYTILVLGLYWIVGVGAAVVSAAVWLVGRFEQKHTVIRIAAAGIIGGVTSFSGVLLCVLLMFRGTAFVSPALLSVAGVCGAVALVATAVPVGRR